MDSLLRLRIVWPDSNTILLLSKRMNGFVTDFVPGTDHAGIAT
jgi:hypothetical protein